MLSKKFIGIDVSSKKLNIHILGARVADFEIANIQASIKDFIKNQKINPKEFIVGVESTGKYHLICQVEFVKREFELRVLNPILTGQKIASSIRKKKTDKSDAKIIARLLSQGEGSIIYEGDLDKSRRSILRTRKTIVNHKASCKSA